MVWANDQSVKTRVALSEELTNTFTITEKVDLLYNQLQLLENKSHDSNTPGESMTMALEDAHSWLSKFNAYSKIDQWQDADKCLIFSTYIDGVLAMVSVA